MNMFAKTVSWPVALTCAALISIPTLRAEPIPFGSSQIQAGTGTNAITIFTYKPPTYKDGPLLFVFHGVLRNAKDYRDFGIAMGDRFNALIAAPLFASNRFSSEDYQKGGLLKKGVPQDRTNWTFSLVPQIVEEVRNREGKPNQPYYFIGHSGGGQFLMRLSAFSPLEAKRIVAANPGSDLFPRRDWKFGYGFGGLPKNLSDDAELQRYLAAPLTLDLGTADIDPHHPELDVSEAAEREGAFRLARGRACFEYAKELAAKNGWTFNWRKVETPGIAHDGRSMLAAKEVALALFGADQPPGK